MQGNMDIHFLKKDRKAVEKFSEELKNIPDNDEYRES